MQGFRNARRFYPGAAIVLYVLFPSLHVQLVSAEFCQGGALRVGLIWTTLGICSTILAWYGCEMIKGVIDGFLMGGGVARVVVGGVPERVGLVNMIRLKDSDCAYSKPTYISRSKARE